MCQMLKASKAGKAEARPPFLRTPCSYRQPPPGLGEHTDALLSGAGFSAQEIAQLREKGSLAEVFSRKRTQGSLCF